MINTSFISRIIIFLINASGIWLALWVLSNNQKKVNNRLFFVMTLALILWVDLAAIANFIDRLDYSLLLIRLDFAVSSIILICMFFFVLYFPDDTLPENIKKQEIVFKLSSLLAVILSLLNFFLAFFAPFVIEKIVYESWGINIILGEWSFIFYLNSFLLVLLILFFLRAKYTNIEKRNRLKVFYFIFGFAIFVALNIVFNIILPQSNNFQLALLGHYSVIIFLGFTAYAIVKNQLFGIKVVVISTIINFIAILLLGNIAFSNISIGFKAIELMAFVVFLFLSRKLLKYFLQEDIKIRKLEAKADNLKKANEYLRESE